MIGEFASAVYFARNADRVFNPQMDKKFMTAAEESHAILEVRVLIIGNDPEGKPVQERIAVRGPGTKTSHEMARQVLIRSMQIAEERLIAVKQMTATVKGTNELLFSYMCPVSQPEY